MRITRIRDLNGHKIKLKKLVNTLDHKLKKAGFVTEVTQVNSTSVHLGLHMRSFRIDPAKLGYNANTGRDYANTPKGYKRTTTPLWSQREDYNHVVNDVLDQFKLNATVKSGNYIVRDYMSGPVHYWYPEEGHQDFFIGLYSGNVIKHLMSEAEAIKDCNTVQRLAEHKVKRAEVRRVASKQRRDEIMRIKQTGKCIIKGGYSYKHGKHIPNMYSKTYSYKYALHLISQLPKYKSRILKIMPVPFEVKVNDYINDSYRAS